HPVRQAIAAEAGKIHQVDVLHVGALAQMLDEAPERGGLELGAGLVVKRHGASFRLTVRVLELGVACDKNSDGAGRFPARLKPVHSRPIARPKGRRALRAPIARRMFQHAAARLAILLAMMVDPMRSGPRGTCAPRGRSAASEFEP